MFKGYLSRNVLGLYIFKSVTRLRLVMLERLNRRSSAYLQYVAIMEIFKDRLPYDANCMDIGASKGDILDLIMKVCPDGSHIAIEAIPVFCRFLRRYYASKNVQIINAVVGEHEGSSPFYFVSNEPAISGTTKTNKPEKGVDQLYLPSIRLDSILAKELQVHCIKVDCIGSELAVFKGASQLLSHQKPLLVFECTPTHNTVDMVLELYDYLNNLGYNIYLLEVYPEHVLLNRNSFKNIIFHQSKCQFFAL